MALSALGRAALAYPERLGFPVFPIAPRGKLPLISKAAGGSGFKDATTDTATIETWWKRWPSANIGVALGEVAGGVFALDIDPRAEGDANLAALLAQYGSLPDTLEACTGGGGRHIFFRGEVGSGVLEEGVEHKGNGGYVVAPPSIHPNGRQYLWEISSRPGDVAIADTPEWLLKLLGSERRREYFEHENSIDPNSFALGAAFTAAGWLGRELRPGVWCAVCPNDKQHSSGETFDSSTVVFAPSPGRYRGRFFCSHAHCREVYR
ncbi:MAG: bifunctional DNA primase/polymerase [Polyangiaceae bacterium]